MKARMLSWVGLLAVAGICIAGLAGTAVVMARRRRT